MAVEAKVLRRIFFDTWIPYVITAVGIAALLLILSIFQPPAGREHTWLLAKLALLLPLVVGTVHAGWRVFIQYARTHD